MGSKKRRGVKRVDKSNVYLSPELLTKHRFFEYAEADDWDSAAEALAAAWGEAGGIGPCTFLNIEELKLQIGKPA